jgi:ribosomal protein S18 acetylase RimI-like enzyme
MDDKWILKNLNIYFRFRRFKLFYGKLRSIVLDMNFSGLPTQGVSIPTLPRDVDKGIDCIMLRFYLVPKRLPRFYWDSGYIRYVPFRTHRYFIEFKNSFADYLKKFSKRKRHDLRRNIRKYNKLCGHKKPWKEFQQPNEMDEFYRLALEVAQKAYQDRLFAGGLAKKDGFDQFLREITELSENGHPLGYVLFRNNKPIAYMVCIVFNKAVHAISMGYDPEYRKLGPGTLLTYYILEDLFKDMNYEFFDFGVGDYEFKKLFSTVNYFCANICFFRFRPKNILIIFFHLITHIFSASILKCSKIFIKKVAITRQIIAHLLWVEFY